MNDISQLQQEQQYYLPGTGTALAGSWEKKSESQMRYIDLCQRGHTMIANQILEGIRNGHPPSVKELYQTAAKIRRAIAVLNQSGSAKSSFYGQPMAFSMTVGLKDTLNQMPGSRYIDIFDDAKARFGETYEKVRTSQSEDGLFGKDFHIRRPRGSRWQWCFEIYHPDMKDFVSSVLLGSADGPYLVLHHAAPQDHPVMFGWADRNLNKIYEGCSEEEYWKQLGEISLHLFHMAPLRLGSQTATLMVLAGISKAMGYEVVPRKVETDHFVEAELTPYTQYIEQYAQGFSHRPRRTNVPEQFGVDSGFMDEARARVKAEFAGETDPCKRLEAYINTCWDLPEKPLQITTLEIEGEKIKVTVFPKSVQQNIDYACQFVGADDMIATLDLPEGRFVKALSQTPSTIKITDRSADFPVRRA